MLAVPVPSPPAALKVVRRNWTKTLLCSKQEALTEAGRKTSTTFELAYLGTQ
jgi:hypothetical protein